MTLIACSSSSDTTPQSNISQSPPPAEPGVGGIIISGRINPINQAASTLTPTSATPDRLTATIEEVAISADDKSYDTVMTGPLQVSFDQSSPPPNIGEKDGINAGTYKALRLNLSTLDWDVQWGFSNPSPCNGATTGSATGSMDLNNKTVLYFKTADLGGNTLMHYQTTPPQTGYPGDAKHPFILPAPIEVVNDKSTTVNLLIDSYRTLGCNSVSIFARNDNGDLAPQREIDGSSTALYDVGLMALDPRRNQIGVLNRFTSSIVYFDGNTAGGDINPERILMGQDTALNGPSGVAFYCPKLNPTDQACDVNISATDQYIVANRNNNSITTYAAIASNNTAPTRSIYGYLTELDHPSDIAINLDPSGNPAKDEILVTNMGNNSITTHARLDFGNSQPIRTIMGSSTGLDKPCGIAIEYQSQIFFVTNSDNDSVTGYHTNDTGDIVPFITLAGSNTGLASPCGISIDSANQEIIVANTGNDSILTFSNDALNSNFAFSAGYNNIAPIRSISGPTTKIHQPTDAIVAGNELWITHKGEQATMALAPTITPVSNLDTSSNAQLDGIYNIVINGIDYRQGVNGLGDRIPIFFSDRGTAHFDSQAAPWPSFTFNIDTESRRQSLESGCTAPNYQVQNGFYGVGANQRFYAATENHQGIINGGFVSNGQDFTSTFLSNNEIFVAYGTKATGTKVQYLTTDGTDSGAETRYSYVSYINRIVPYELPLSARSQDSLLNRLEVGGSLRTNSSAFLSLNYDLNQELIFSPMGYVSKPQSVLPIAVTGFGFSRQLPYISHAGGLFEDADFGTAGISSADSELLLLMRDITNKDVDNCPLTIGMGFGTRRTPAGTYGLKDFKGTFYLSGFGDKFLSPSILPQYFSISGTLTFDGAGNVSTQLVENSDGDLSFSNDPMSYEIVDNSTIDIMKIRSELTGALYAQAFIARDGKTLVMYSPTGASSESSYGNTIRLLGYAILQNP